MSANLTAVEATPRSELDREAHLGLRPSHTAGALERLLDHPQFTQPRYWHPHRFATGSVVVEEASQTGKLYLVLEGELRVLTTVTLGGGRKIHPGIADLGRGDVFGELALFDRTPHCACVRALSDCRIALIDASLLTRFMENHPEVGYAVLNAVLAQVAPRLRKMNARLCHLLAWGIKAHQLDRF